MDDADAGRLIVQWDAKIDKFIEKANQVLEHSKHTAKHVEESWDNINIGHSLEKVFDSSRLAVLDAGAEHLRVFGSALEPLGPIGLAAGAALAAFGIAAEQAGEAAEWAENLNKTAEKLGLTTDALQEFDFIALRSGISTDVFRGALQELNEKIGQVESGVASGKVAKIFQALKISPEELRRLGSLQAILPEIAEKLDQLAPAERAGLAARLGIGPLIPALEMLADKSRAAQKEAHELGLVLDRETIEQGEKAAEKFKLAADIIDKNFKQAFLNVAPAMAQAQVEFAKFAKGIADFLAKPETLRFLALLNSPVQMIFGGFGFRPSDTLNRMADKSLNVGLSTEELKLKPDPKVAKPTGLVGDPEAAKKAEEVKKASQDAIAKAADEELKARQALTENIQERLDIETQLLATETAQKIADLQSEVALKKITPAAAAVAEATIQRAQAAKQEALEREAQNKRDNQYDSDQKSISEDYSAMAKITAALAKTLAMRRDIEMRDLKERQRLELAHAQTEAEHGVEADPSRAEYYQIQIEALKARQAAEIAELTHQNQGPGANYVEGLEKTTGDISTSLQQVAVKGLEDLNTNLAKAIVNAKDFGQAFGNALRSVETDLINLALEKYLTLPLAQALGLAGGGGLGGLFGIGGSVGSASGAGSLVNSSFSFSPSDLMFSATGTDWSPGGMTMVGENGPEILNIPKGAQIVPNNLLGNLPMPAGGAGGASIYIDNRGAVMTQDLVDNMNQAVAAAEQRAVMKGAALGVQAARTLIPTEMSRRASLQIR